MALRLGLQNLTLLLSPDRRTSVIGNVQREKIPVWVQEDCLTVSDNNCRVRGTTNLRIGDAPVFPYIPGFSIVTPVYMVAEKASEVTLADAKQGTVW